MRDAFLRGYTVDGVAGRLGPVATAALARHETVPARRATGRRRRRWTPWSGCSCCSCRCRRSGARRALPLEAAVGLGVLYADGDEVHARLDVRPYRRSDGDGGDDLWWVVSDLGTGLDGTGGPLPAEHVLGVGGASTTLAQLTPRRPVGRTLDVGTGCGVQALHASPALAARSSRTDVSPRALQLAGLTAALSGVRLELRLGDLLEPARGETFDLVVSNPPFVIGAPAGGTRHTYRDSGLPARRASAPSWPVRPRACSPRAGRW